MKRTLILILAVIAVLSIIIDLLAGKGEGHGGLLGFHMPGLFALFGFVACIAIVIISKLIGHYWLQRKEDYYNGKDDDE